MSINININLDGFSTVAKIHSPGRYQNALGKGHKRLVLFGESRVGLNARNIVYSYRPKTNSYRRTGRLLGGRGGLGGMPFKQELGQMTTLLEANPQRKGASFNYAPYVNAGEGWMKRVGARPFWDKSIQEIQSEGVKKAQEEILKNLK